MSNQKLFRKWFTWPGIVVLLESRSGCGLCPP